MHRIDGPGHDGNLFSEGNPVEGEQPTTVTDDWLNDMQEEVVSVIAAAGISLTKGEQDQLLNAIRRLTGGHVTALTDAGSPHTLTLAQVGLVLIDASAGNVVVTMPLAADLAAARFRLVRVDASGNTVTIQRDGTDTISPGGTSISLPSQYAEFALMSDGVDTWHALAGLNVIAAQSVLGRAAGTSGPPAPIVNAAGAGRVLMHTGAELGWALINAANSEGSWITPSDWDAASASDGRVFMKSSGIMQFGLIGAANLGGSAVGAGNLATGLQQASPGILATGAGAPFILTGGQYAWWTIGSNDSTLDDSSLSIIRTHINAAYSAVVAVVNVSGGSRDYWMQSRYVTSSRKAELGGVPLPVVVWAVVYPDGRIGAISVADDVPWYYNGPTPLSLHHKRVFETVDGSTRRRWVWMPRLAKPGPGAPALERGAYREALCAPFSDRDAWEAREVTPAVINLDLPHVQPFDGNDLRGGRVVLLDWRDEALMERLHSLLHLGEPGYQVADLLREGDLRIDNSECDEALTPAERQACGGAWHVHRARLR